MAVSALESRLKPFIYFAVDAPLNQAKFFCTNRTGTVSYGVTFKLRSIFDENTQTIIHEKEETAVCRVEVITGQMTIYKFDDKLTVADCRSAIDCYLLDDKILVLVGHSRLTQEFNQMIFYLCGLTKKAIITHTKTKRLVDFTHDVSIGQGLLSRGQVAIVGSKGPFDGEREVVAQLIAANPLREDKYPDVNLTKKIADFRQYLKKYNADFDIFQKGVYFDHDGIYFLIKKGELSQLAMGFLGKLIYKPNGDCDYLLMKPTSPLELDGWIMTKHLTFSVQSGKSLWLALDPPNFDEMLNLSWRLYHWWLPKLLFLMIKGIELAVWMQRFDGGWCLQKYIRLLMWYFGPTLAPAITPDPIFFLYHLDLEKNILRRAEAKPILTKTMLGPAFLLAADIDATGGLTLYELADSKTTVEMSYYPCPTRPPRLDWLATHRVYRLFPALEKAPAVRRMLGQTEFIY